MVPLLVPQRNDRKKCVRKKNLKIYMLYFNEINTNGFVSRGAETIRTYQGYLQLWMHFIVIFTKISSSEKSLDFSMSVTDMTRANVSCSFPTSQYLCQIITFQFLPGRLYECRYKLPLLVSLFPTDMSGIRTFQIFRADSHERIYSDANS